VAEICSSISKPATHNFLDCVVILVELASHAIQRPPKEMSVREPIPEYMVGSLALPSHPVQLSLVSNVPFFFLMNTASHTDGSPSAENQSISIPRHFRGQFP